MSNSNYIIAIDGYSSTGKSSISKEVAKYFGYIHIDTGAMYRAVTLYAMEHFWSEETGFHWQHVIEYLPNLSLEFKRNALGENEMYLNHTNVEKNIRSIHVSEHVSDIAKQAEIRHFLVEKQRDLGKNGGVVMDGRDIGSVVFPMADYKFFLTATVEERAKRRYKQLTEAGVSVTIEEITQNLVHRDSIDESRDVAPLKILPDSIVVDNTTLDKAACVQFIINYILKNP